MADFLAPEGTGLALARPPIVSDGLLTISYPVDEFDLRRAVSDRLIDLGITAVPEPLETIHHRLPPAKQLEGQTLAGAPTIKSDSTLQALYRSLVRFLAREVLREDVVFEANPPLRFHFPMPMPDRLRAADGIMLTHHSDIMGGDPIDQINGWIPLTDCDLTAALQYVSFSTSRDCLQRFALALGNDPKQLAQSRYRFFDELLSDTSMRQRVLDEARPLRMKYGEVALFDARLIHGTAENVEDVTRVSIDFRLLPMRVYEELAPRWVAHGNQRSSRWAEPLIGQFYDELRAYEL